MHIRTARPSDLPALSALALRSKAHWGYPEDVLATMRDELTWDAEDLGRLHFRVGERRAGDAGCNAASPTSGHDELAVIGFSALERLDDRRVELEALFLEPACIGSGYGAALLADAVAQAQAWQAHVMVIQSDPHAEQFYLAHGARRVGESPSGSIPGRKLPLLELALD